MVPDNNVPETRVHNEDCLFLNVFRPTEKAGEKANDSRAVMVWIHGGGFETGSIFSVAYDASYISAIGDVIVVTIQYRLGAFGFLTANTTDERGNNGLHDQIMALQWVQDNIASFGGNPHKVTIFGESAGGMSVGALVLSPLAAGLFQRAVLQSGAPNSYLGSQGIEASLGKTAALAEKVNCTNADKQELLKCLRNVKPETIVDANEHARVDGETFQPIWGEELLPVKPAEALKTGKFNRNLDVMFGTVSEEGALFVEAIFPTYMDPDDNTQTLNKAQAKTLIKLMFKLFQEDFGEEVADYYTQHLTDNSSLSEVRQSVGDSFGDYHLTCPTVLFGQYYGHMGKNDRVYAYRVVQPPAIPVFLKCHGWMGVCHGDDVMYIFAFPIRLRGIVFTEYDFQLSLDMINTWTTFAKTGKPLRLMRNAAIWKEAIDHKNPKSSVSYMSLEAKNYHMVDDFYVKQCETFWKPKIL